ncbi:MAG TPA: hypothetical protein VFD50_03185 [Thermoleophilia bacterium]|nr:hypothetical protein [Thermoleophilia bacterium]
MRRRAILVLAGAAVLVLASAAPAFARRAAPSGARAGARTTGWTLTLRGRTTKVLPIAQVPATATWDGTRAGNINRTLRYVYKGQLLYKLVGMVDDNAAGFNAALAKKGYTIQLFGLDGYKQTFSSKVLFRNGKLRTDLIVAKMKAGKLLPAGEGPFRFVGGPPITQPFNCKLSAFELFKIRLIF